jgi:hypothetical protein
LKWAKITGTLHVDLQALSDWSFLMKMDCSPCEVLAMAKETADHLKIITEVDYDLCEVQVEAEEYSSI